MADTHAKNHDYHLVNPSPWPIVGAVSAFILAVGAVTWMHGGTWIIMTLGFLMVLYTMFMWWRDVLREAHAGDHTPVVGLHLRYGMLLFIASEVMFFVAWFWAFFDASLFANEAKLASRVAVTGGIWPPCSPGGPSCPQPAPEAPCSSPISSTCPAASTRPGPISRRWPDSPDAFPGPRSPRWTATTSPVRAR